VTVPAPHYHHNPLTVKPVAHLVHGSTEAWSGWGAGDVDRLKFELLVRGRGEVEQRRGCRPLSVSLSVRPHTVHSTGLSGESRPLDVLPVSHVPMSSGEDVHSARSSGLSGGELRLLQVLLMSRVFAVSHNDAH